MTRITVCIGSACHLKGSRQVLEALRDRIAAHPELTGAVELASAFCMGDCTHGVCVNVGDAHFSVSPETVDSFFTQHVLPLAQ